MASAKPGDHITARCRRCDDITGHIVMLLLDGQIAKVECRACGSVHKYRETREPGLVVRSGERTVRHVKAGESRETAKDVSAPRPTRRTPAPAARPAARRQANAAKLESAWQEAMLRHSATTPVPYSMQAAFAVQDVIEHPTFGRGEVLSVSPPDKMDVLFQDGVKTLRCKL